LFERSTLLSGRPRIRHDGLERRRHRRFQFQVGIRFDAKQDVFANQPREFCR